MFSIQSEDDIDFQVIIDHWMRKQREELHATLKDLINNYLLKGIDKRSSQNINH